MGCVLRLWCKTANQAGWVANIVEGMYPSWHDDAAAKRQKTKVEQGMVILWSTRSANMHGPNLEPQAGPRTPCQFGDHFRQSNDGMFDVDYNNVAIASMIAAHGPNVAMAKLIFMHATQTCYVERQIDWPSIGSIIATMAHMVIGGTWSAGVSGWSYQHLGMAEIYVFMVEDKALWMGRNIGSAHVHFGADGYVEAL